jgi:hypothetical protein
MKRETEAANTLACELIGETVRTSGGVRLRVFGTSMAPSVLPGDLISVQRAGVPEISIGEIVLYSREGRLFAHRVVERVHVPRAGSAQQTFLITCGDRLRHKDAPVSSADLLGRVVSIERGDRQLEPLAQPSRSNLALARLLRASDRATYLYLRLAALWRALFPGRVAQCRA